MWGFVFVDEDTTRRQRLHWARVLVKFRGWKVPSFVQVVVGGSCYVVQLWWDFPPWRSEVVSSVEFRERQFGVAGGESSFVTVKVGVRASERVGSHTSIEDTLKF